MSELPPTPALVIEHIHMLLYNSDCITSSTPVGEKVIYLIKSPGCKEHIHIAII